MLSTCCKLRRNVNLTRVFAAATSSNGWCTGSIVSSDITTGWRRTSINIVGSLASQFAPQSRLYSSTRVVLKDETKDDNKDTKQTASGEKKSSSASSSYKVMVKSDDPNDQLSEEEIDKLFAEYEIKFKEEQEEKNRLPLYWRPGMRRKPRKVTSDFTDVMRQVLLDDKDADLSKLEPENEEEQELLDELRRTPWTLRDIRCGALALKVGMMPVFDHWGELHPCTVLHLDNNIVLGNKTMEKHGYNAVQVAAGERKRKNVGKCLMGQYKGLFDNELSEHPPYTVKEFRVSEEAHLIPVHTRIHARHFVPGQNIDVSGITKGKGFQGPMKRHGFGGMPASHGVSKSHRAHGSTGQCQDPGRVFKGKKMAGHMGVNRVTKQNLRIVKIDCGRNLIYVKGSVPGNKGNFVEIRDAIKRPLWKTKMVPEKMDRPPIPTFEFDPQVDGSGETGHAVFMPLPEIDPLNPELNNNDVVNLPYKEKP